MKLLSTFILLLLSLAVRADLTVSNLTTTIVMSPSLVADMANSVNTKAVSTNTASYSPLGVATNISDWTYPYNFSSVGITASGFQSVLIAPNAVISFAHFGGVGTYFIAMGTDGVTYTNYVAASYSTNDLVLAVLSNSFPSTVVVPFVMPPEYTNYVPALGGVPAIWLHNVTRTIDYIKLSNVTTPGFQGSTIHFTTSTNDPHGTGIYPSSGDSGSPNYILVDGIAVLVGCVGDTGGGSCFMSCPAYYQFITNHIAQSSLKLFDFTLYRKIR